mmetsp:Transcript_113369/g.218249  ORF Transcript_113369/g.218249 Transcript_113369/m.218249 type:complete len:228 (+) Transcript_113369:543-1226(+)
MVGVSASLAGAEMMTFFAPLSMCFKQPSVVVKAPVDSQTYSTPADFHGISVGSRVAERDTGKPLMMRPSSEISTVPSKRPCTVSWLSKYFMYSGDIGELMCFSTNASRSIAIRTTWRPMRPKPFTPSLMGASGLVDILMAPCLLEVAGCAPGPEAANADFGLDANRSVASACTSPSASAARSVCCWKPGVCIRRPWAAQVTQAKTRTKERMINIKIFATNWNQKREL